MRDGEKASSHITTPMLYGLGLVALALVILAGLRMMNEEREGEPLASPPVATAVEQPGPSRPMLNGAIAEKAKRALAAEAKVIDVAYDPSLQIQWIVAVVDDGTRRDGLADYFCMVLSEHGALVDGTAVRIVDAARRAEFKDAYREYALATVDCTTHSTL